MTTSGASDREFNILEIVEEAYERTGSELRTGYQLKTAIRSLDLLMVEWANRGYNLWTIQETSTVTADGDDDYNLSDDIIDVITVNITVDDFDYPLTRMSTNEYTKTPNLTTESRPTSFWVKRTVIPVLYLYPTPDQVYTLKYWSLRRIYDAGAGTNTMDVPFRFLPAMIAGLSHKLAAKSTERMELVPMLEAEYEKQFQLATEEDRERSSLYIRVRRRG